MCISWRMLDVLLKPSVWLFDKSRHYRMIWRARLPRSAKVLEIGCGHNPWPRANVLCDLHPDDNVEREGKPLHRDRRPFVCADASALPFEDGSFDFVYCSHVAEHVTDIGGFFEEIQRVGRAGYIETPNYLFEQAVGTATHVWALYIADDGALVAERKPYPGAPARVYHGWHAALARHPLLRISFQILPEMAPMSFWWKGRFNYRILPAPSFLDPTRAVD